MPSSPSALHGGRAGAVAVSALTAHRAFGGWDEMRGVIVSAFFR